MLQCRELEGGINSGKQMFLSYTSNRRLYLCYGAPNFPLAGDAGACLSIMNRNVCLYAVWRQCILIWGQPKEGSVFPETLLFTDTDTLRCLGYIYVTHPQNQTIHRKLADWLQKIMTKSGNNKEILISPLELRDKLHPQKIPNGDFCKAV